VGFRTGGCGGAAGAGFGRAFGGAFGRETFGLALGAAFFRGRRGAAFALVARFGAGLRLEVRALEARRDFAI